MKIVFILLIQQFIMIQGHSYIPAKCKTIIPNHRPVQSINFRSSWETRNVSPQTIMNKQLEILDFLNNKHNVRSVLYNVQL